MKKIRTWLVLIAAFGVALAIYWPSKDGSEQFRPGLFSRTGSTLSKSGRDFATAEESTASITTTVAAANRQTPSGLQTPAALPDSTAPAGSSPASSVEPTRPTTLATELEHVRTIVRDYRLMFLQNPIGSNAEITKVLAGKNPKKVNFLAGEESHISAEGELLDRWGTPYFFHQISGTEMEIRSAGPDKRLWTEDDVIVR